MIIIVMGVEGSGKTTVGSILASAMHFDFADADDFHLAVNIDKMRRGMPLTDADREPWLAALHAAITSWISEQRNMVLACSALKARYRARLLLGPEVKLVYLKVSYDTILTRLKLRQGHYAGEGLLTSQFADLEEPANAISVDGCLPPDEVVREIERRLAGAV